MTGYRCNLVFYIAECIVAFIMMLAFRRLPLPAVIVFVVFVLSTCALLFRGKKKHPLNPKMHMRLQCLFFVIVNLFLSTAFDSAQVFIYGLCFASVVNFVFIDTKQAQFQLWVSMLMVILIAGYVGVYTGSQQTMLVYTFGAVMLFVMNWVIVSVTNILSFQNRKSFEQERSLDDLLKVVEAKCVEAQEATRSKSRFLANMSHEIRTPINSVIGMNEMILRESGEKEICDYASEVKNAAESLLSIINDILDITKIEEGRLTLVTVKYSLDDLISDVNNLIKFRAEAKNLQFEIAADSSLPSVLLGDDIHLKQILTNLLTNAVKYTHKGSVRLGITMQEDGIRFSVKDTGIGIKQEDISRLFNAFDRIEETRNRSIEGTGLGLNITYSLLKMLGSELQVESVYGKGSEFFFVLRQEIVDATPIGELNLARTHKHENYSADFEAPDAKILVVDDNDINRKVFIKLLKKTRVSISEAASGAEAVRMTLQTAFDLIFMDHMMPEMDGVETFKMIRADKENPCCGTPVIALTANAVMGAEEYYQSEGFDGFLSKPIEPKRLEKTMFSMLDKRLLQEPSMAVQEQFTEIPEPKAEEAVVAELPNIEGINWGYARFHLKDDELLMETIELFSMAMEADASELDGYFEKLDTDSGLDSYRIKVHSMKSSSALLGIFALSGMALELEKAAKASDCDTIRAMHPIFIRRWLSYCEPIRALVSSDGPKKSAAENMREIYGIFAQIRCAAEEMDVDLLDEMSARLNEYSFEDELAEKITEVQSMILNFEVEKLVDYQI